MNTVRVGINGLGRIGRAFMRVAHGRPEIEVVAVNDLGSIENLAYLLKYDTVYKRAPFTVQAKEGNLLIDGREVRVLSEKEPAKLPWKDLGVDVVIESTGFFTEFEKAAAHIEAGARRVVISAPAKETEGGSVTGATVLMGLNEDRLPTCAVSSNASCTTNAASPVIAILDQAIGIEKAILSTTHAYTASQAIVDGPSKKDMKEGRAAAQNIVPTSTGAAIAVTKAYPALSGKFDGISLRVPVPAGSIADITFVAKRATTVEEVNEALRKAAKDTRWQGIFAASDEELVSSDIIGERFASIADLGMTRVVDGNLVKVLAWYDNEMGYTETLVQHAIKAGRS
ncbi:MAG: type I glyceraldehyde-3-phosphate dehydrogenase [Candidatus Pacebacteria bacterium]|nr:type I glyceraldehyde-3-phosphate dehydrogenase [Candidatus Paceibacterota bacterium]MBP9840756.1 type I glyceraldehyde-3-phosphate dehydrogenase [Candidatus Paceibacterota bacterium]